MTASTVRARSTDALFWVAFAALVVTYVLASLRDMPAMVYPLKWVALAVLTASVLATPDRQLLLSGVPVPLVFLPWVILALVVQIAVGATARGIGVGGGYLGLLLVAFVVIPSALPTRERRGEFEQRLIAILTAMALVAAVMSLRDPARAIVASVGDRPVRLRWSFEHVNTAGYLGYLGGLLCLRQLHARRFRYLVPMLLFLMFLISAGSRGAILAFAAAVIVTVTGLLLRRFGARSLLAGALAACLLAATIAVVAPDVVERLSFQRLNELMSGRLGGWRAALGRLHGPVEWMVGRGTGQNVSFTGSRAAVGGSSDSLIVDMITRTGVLGTLLWLATMVVVAIMLGLRLARARHRDPERVPAQLFAIGLFVSVLAASGFEGFVFSVGSTFGLLSWTCIGLACVEESGDGLDGSGSKPDPAAVQR